MLLIKCINISYKRVKNTFPLEFWKLDPLAPNLRDTTSLHDQSYNT